MTARYELSLNGRPALDEPYHLTGVGLPNVYLLSGVTTVEDPDYGPLVTIEKVNELQIAIGLSIVKQQRPLTGDEMRFLRKRIGLTQVQLAKKLGVTNQTVAHYEKGKTIERGPADLALRFLYLANVSPNEEVADECALIVRELATFNADQHRAKPRKRPGHWSGSAGDSHAR